MNRAPLSLHVSAIQRGSLCFWPAEIPPGAMCPTQLFCQTTGFLVQRETEGSVLCCLLAGMIVHLHVADGGLCCVWVSVCMCRRWPNKAPRAAALRDGQTDCEFFFCVAPWGSAEKKLHSFFNCLHGLCLRPACALCAPHPRAVCR